MGRNCGLVGLVAAWATISSTVTYRWRISILSGLLLLVAGIGDTIGVGCWHQVAINHVATDTDVIDLQAPVAQILLGIVENLACLWSMLKRWTIVSWDDWGVIEEVEKTAAVARENNLLLGTLNCGSKLGGIGLLELLASLITISMKTHWSSVECTYDVSQLSLSNQVLGLSADKLLLKGDQADTLWFLHLGPLDLILDLSPVVPAWLDTLLGVADSLQDGPRVVQVVRVEVLLLANLTEENTDLVGEVGDGIISSLLTPLGELRSDSDALLASSLVSTDKVVLGLDKLEKTFGEIWLSCATETGKRETTAVHALVRVIFPGVGAD